MTKWWQLHIDRNCTRDFVVAAGQATSATAIARAAFSIFERNRVSFSNGNLALGTEMPSPATSLPSAVRIGTAHPTTPAANSSSLTAHPVSLTFETTPRKDAVLVMVRGVTAGKGVCESHHANSSSGNSARKILPIDVQ